MEEKSSSVDALLEEKRIALEEKRLELEKQRLAAENRFKEEEIALKRQEIGLRLSEEGKKSRGVSPAMTAIIGGLLGLLGTGFGTFLQGRQNLDL